jgi:hypothetical protein
MSLDMLILLALAVVFLIDIWIERRIDAYQDRREAERFYKGEL